MSYTVKTVSELAGISIRTLHHYDVIGLLRPGRATTSGYRIYTEADLERLQQILFLRELGFRLQEIKETIDSPGFDRKQALLDHKQVLLAQQNRLGQLIRTIDRTIEAMERGIPMNGKDMFDGFDPAKYEEEARRQWGNSPAWAESQQRTKKYTRADWDTIQREGKGIEQRIASLMHHGPSHPEVQEWIGKHHKLINDRFYTCTTEIYRGLGDLYVQDERFAAHYEKIKPGMAKFMQAAIHAYCDELASE